MLHRRPELLAVAISLGAATLVLMAFVIDIGISRSQELRNAEDRLQHFSHLLAEHNSRALESIDILVREVASDLGQNNRDWRQWSKTRGWEYAAHRHSRSLPQLRYLAVIDEHGDQQFVSTAYPTPQINVEDRPYFQALRMGQEVASFGPYQGRNTQQFTYSVSRRIVDPKHHFAGLVLGALELNYFQNFCWPNRPSNDFDAVLANSSGEVIASCRPIEPGEESKIFGHNARDVLAQGQLGNFALEAGVHHRQGYLISVAPLQSTYGLQIVAALPEQAALAGWSRRLREFGILAGIILIMLISGGWLVRRQLVSLRSASTHLKARRAELQVAVEQATAELAKEKETAELSSNAKTRFLAAASHDLRQPLHALSLFSADLQRQLSTGTSRDLERLAEQISSSTNSLGEMLDALLDVSRLDLGGVETHIAPLAVQALFNRLLMAFRRAALARHIEIRFRPSSLHISTDAALIERMIANLISNAIRYTPEGGRVLIVARKHDAHVDLEVRDSGIGIAKEEQEVIFEEFYQVGNAARDQQKGLGLGLSIVNRIGRALGTPITVRSRPGFGATLRVRTLYCVAPEIVETSLPAVVFVGHSDDLEQAAEVVKRWGQPCRQLDDIRDLGLTHNQRPTVIFTTPESADLMRARLPYLWPVVAVGSGVPREGIHVLQTPVRPAKLRALVQQLQKTLSKSIL